MRHQETAGLRGLLQQPLLRLLAINLASGIAAATLLLGGLLVLNPFGLRHLIFADNSPGTALALLLFGFVVTFGSAAMGSAIMALSEYRPRRGDGHGPKLPVATRETRTPAPARLPRRA